MVAVSCFVYQRNRGRPHPEDWKYWDKCSYDCKAYINDDS